MFLFQNNPIDLNLSWSSSKDLGLSCKINLPVYIWDIFGREIKSLQSNYTRPIYLFAVILEKKKYDTSVYKKPTNTLTFVKYFLLADRYLSNF